MKSLFFTEYLKNIRTVGAITPSSRYLARKMLDQVDFTRASLIVEYGPGTGAFTAEIMKRKHPGTKLLVIETNPTFYQLLLTEYTGVKNIEIVNASAEIVASLLKERRLPAPDYVISGLPFAALPPETSHTILAETAALLDTNGTFITFQYTLLKRELFRSHFAAIHIAKELRNLPPAYVFRCSS